MYCRMYHFIVNPNPNLSLTLTLTLTLKFTKVYFKIISTETYVILWLGGNFVYL